jgi:hypothetical protein
METRREAAAAALQVVQKRRSDLAAVQLAATARKEAALTSLKKRPAQIVETIERMETERWRYRPAEAPIAAIATLELWINAIQVGVTLRNQRRTTRSHPMGGAGIKRRRKTPVDLGMAAMANPVPDTKRMGNGGEVDLVTLVANRANLNHTRLITEDGTANLEKIITCIPTLNGMKPITQLIIQPICRWVYMHFCFIAKIYAW